MAGEHVSTLKHFGQEFIRAQWSKQLTNQRIISFVKTSANPLQDLTDSSESVVKVVVATSCGSSQKKSGYGINW